MADVPAFPGFPGSPSSPSTPSTPSGGVTPVFPPAVPYINTAPAAATDSNSAANTVAEGAAVNTLVGITAHSTDAEGQTVTYSLGADSSGGGFKIDPATGVVSVADSSKINFETAPGHVYTITVNSSDGITSSAQNFTIAVSDVAPSTPVDSNAAANAVTEGAANGSTVGITASSTDVNGPAVTYSLVGDTSGGGFTINAATGVVTVADSTKIDYESAPGHAYTITVQSSDGTLTSSQTFTIAVNDVPLSAPVDSNAAANSVVEGAANGSTVGITAQALDPNGPVTTYSLIGDSSLGGFTINAATGVVTVADGSKIDYESAAGHAYTVTVQAQAGAQVTTQSFTIGVTDVAPSSPVDSDGAANTVTEGAANGSHVGITASSTDVNGPAVTFSLIGDTSGGGFTINAATGVITVADSTKIDYETAAGHAYTVTAQASDGTLASSQTFTIGVTDVAPSIPVDSNAAANAVAEGAAAGSLVGITASSTDVNGPGVTYSLVGDTSGGGFTINAATGVVTVADPSMIDYESAPGHAYTITAQASDGTLTSSQTFTIGVLDVAPSTPVDSNAAANTISEGAANGSLVGITAHSNDVNGPNVTYSLVGDTSGGGFTINATTGEILVADSTKIDYETSGGSYSVVAQASDGTLASSQAFTIGVTDVAPSTPVDTNAAANTVSEGAANGSTVGVTASSTDVNGPAVTYSLVADTSGGGFTINAATGVVTVADSTKIDFENSGGSYTVTAQASDGTLTSSHTFTIAVSDVAPSTPVDSDASANAVLEGAAAGSTVGVTASSTDVNGPAVTYSLTGDTSGGGFTINATTGVVTVADPTKIDFETSGGSYTVTTQASDGTLTSSQAFVIAVTDVAPSTPVDSDAGANTIVEGAANGSTVGVTASSSDVNGPAVTYSLIGDTSGGGFTINSATGVVTVVDSTKIDFETSGGSYTVTAQASDGTLASSQAFVIAVTDVAPSTPVDSDATANNVVQNAAVGSTVGVTASSTDVNGPGVTYSLTGDTSGGGFTINAATGVVTVADSSKIIFISNPTTYDVTVDSSDGTLHAQQTFTINVDPNAAPIIDSNGGGATAAVSAAENQTAVTTVHATDPDNSPVTPVAYSIVGGDDQLKFAIDSGTGVLTFITPPDFENPTDTSTAGNNTYIVVVQASDGAAIDQQTITVTVTDKNDAPVITSNGGGATASINVNENTTAVTTVTSTDQDIPPQTLTYSLAGGADQGKFSINASTGVLTFNTAPNFETPTDVGGDNGYDVIVRVTDNGAPNLHDDQAITVHVQDVNEAPDTAAVTVTGNEDASSIAITITGTDVDAGDSVASFHITNVPNTGTQGTLYSDAGLTQVVTNGADVAASGNAATLYFVGNANFNTHAGAVTFNAAATDSHSLTDATPATETINVTAVNDAPVNNGVPANFIAQSGFAHTITGLSISDVDANEVGTPTDITTTFTAGAGFVSIGNGGSGGTAGIAGGATITTNGTGTVTLTGSIAQINTTLSGNNVSYTAPDNTGTTTTTLQMATNDHGHNGTGGAITDTDTINIGITPQVWFINQDQSALDANAPRGSQTNPFATVDEFNASSGPGVNDYIYVKAGTYDGEGINLKAGQTLLGDDQALSFTNPLGGPAIVIEDATGARPTINVTAAHATDQGIALSTGNTVAGIIVTTNASGQVGIDDSGASVGTLNISDTDVTGGGQAINLTHGGTGGSVALGTVSSSGGTVGIALGGALATNFSATSGTLSGHSSAEFSSNGGSGTVSYGGTIGDGTGLSASIVNRTGGTVTLSGNINDSNDTGGGIGVSGNANTTVNFTGTTKTLDTGIGDGVSITNNTGTSNVNFTNGGLTVHTTNGTSFQDTVAGTVSVTGTGNTLSTTGTGTALNLSHVTVGAGGVTFDSASTTNAATGILIDTVTGGAINVNGGSIAGASTNGVSINAAQDNITIASAITSTAAGHSVQVTNSGTNGGNTITFSGAVTDPGLGINLDNNDQNAGVATVNFTGALNIDSTTHTGFNATNGGTVNATNAANSITTTTGTALIIANTTIGSSNVSFHDISSNGAVNGIFLNNTGTSGHLVVTGTGTTAGSGGTIQNSTGDGVSLTSTQDVSLNNMNITNGAGNGINGNTLNGLVLNGLTVSGNGNSTAGNGEGNIYLSELTGGNASHVTTFNNLTVSNAYVHDVFIENTAGTLTDLQVTNSTFSNNGASQHAGDAFQIFLASGGIAGSPTATVHASHNTFSGNLSTPATFTATGFAGSADDGTLNLHIGDGTAAGLNTFSTNDSGITVNATNTGNINFDINDNTVTINRAVGITANNQGSGVVTGFIRNNTVGTQGVQDSGAAIGAGIDIDDEGTGAGHSTTLAITNNIVQSVGDQTNQLGFQGINVLKQSGSQNTSGVFNLTLTGNTIRDIWNDRGLLIEDLNNAGNSSMNLNVSGNTFSNANAQGGTTTARIGGGPAGTDHVNVTQANAAALAAANGLTASNSPGNNMRVDTNVFFNNAAPALPPATPQLALNGEGPGSADTLTMDQLAPLLFAAIQHWADAGASTAQIALLENTHITISDIASAGVLANTDANGITVDANGAGWGWFIDQTPNNNSEFSATSIPNDLKATSGAAAGHIDLLTVVEHEMGHVLGLDDSTQAGIMNVNLDTGERRAPDAADVNATLSSFQAVDPTAPPDPASTASSTAAASTAGQTFDAGQGGHTFVATAGPDNFVFNNVAVHAPTPPPVTLIENYSFAQGDKFDFSAITSQFHDSGLGDGLIVRAVEDASGKFATLQVDTIDPHGLPGQPTWVNVAQIDGAHAGDAVNVLIDGQAVHLAQIHVGLLA